MDEGGTKMRSHGGRLLASIVGASLVIGLFAPAAGMANAALRTSSSATGVCAHVPTAEARLIHGRLTACGNAIVDGSRHRVRLRTYEFLGMLPGNGDLTPKCLHWQAPAASFALHLRQRGFNSVFM